VGDKEGAMLRMVGINLYAVDASVGAEQFKRVIVIDAMAPR
jgi:hypothetical protein